MTRVVLLDTGPLGLVTHPRAERNRAAAEWLSGLLSSGVSVMVPEICDYELRRELLRSGKTKGVRRLDELEALTGYVPLTTQAMLLAARFWAEARARGAPTAADPALDADVILAAQSATLEVDREDLSVLIATTNVGHLSRFVAAQEWSRIRAE